MGILANKAIVRAFTKAGNKGDLEATVKYTAIDCPLNGQPFGREGDRARTAAMIAAFPTGRTTLDEMIGHADKVVVRWTFKGTQKGTLMGIPPTGKKITMVGISIYTFKDGMLVDIREQYDKYGFLQQLGVIPA